MGNDIQKGTIYAEGGIGGSGTVNAANLNAHVDEARIKASFISSKSLKDPAGLGDAFVVENSGVLYRMTMQQVLDLINTTVQGLLPVGTIVDFAADAVPDGWLLCAGQAISRDVWEELWLRIGTRYGAGNGVDTFNLPDLRGRVTAGVDNMGGGSAGRLTTATINNPNLASGVGGEQTITLTADGMPSHYHNTYGVDHLHYCNAPNHTHNFTDYYAAQTGRGNVQYGNGTNVATVTLNNATAGSNQSLAFWSGAADRSLNSTTDYQGGAHGHNNMPPTMVLNKIIRAHS